MLLRIQACLFAVLVTFLATPGAAQDISADCGSTSISRTNPARPLIIAYGINGNGDCGSASVLVGMGIFFGADSYDIQTSGGRRGIASCGGSARMVAYGQSRTCSGTIVIDGNRYAYSFTVRANLTTGANGDVVADVELQNASFSRTTAAPIPILSAPATANTVLAVTLTSDVDLDDASIAPSNLQITGTGSASGSVDRILRFSARQFRYSIVLDGEGTLTFQVPAGAVTSTTGISNPDASVAVEVAVDAARPTATFSALPQSVGLTPVPVTLTFSEEVTGMTLDALSLVNLTASNLQTNDNVTFTFDVVASADGPATVTFNGSSVRDLSGNAASTNPSVETMAVISRPTITFVGVETSRVTDERIYRFIVSRPAGGRLAYTRPRRQPALENATISTETLNFVTGELSIAATPNGGDVSVSWPEGAYFEEETGNTSLAFGPTIIEMIDQTPPQPIITYTGYSRLAPFTATIDFGEPVTGFDIGDVSAVAANLTGFVAVNAQVYTVEVQPLGGLDAPGILVAADVAEDLAGNANLASPPVTPPGPDGTAPVVTIEGIPDGFSGPQVSRVTFDWGESVIDFRDDDISVTGGSLGIVTGGPQVWTADLTIAGDVDVGVTVRAGAVLDATGTPNETSTVTGLFDSGAIAEEIIREFLGARSAALLSAQPRLTGLLDNDGPGGSISVTRAFGALQLHTGNEGPVWAALNANWSDIDGFETAYTHVSFGTHMYLQDETLLGMMVQLDHAASSEGVSDIEGSGWLIGPYYVARYGGLDLDARLLWGRTENAISPMGTYTDRFSTERVLAMVNLSGEIEAGMTQLRPLVGWAFVEDRSEAYLDGLSNPVAAQRVRLSQLEVALDWTRPLSTSGLEFTGGIATLFTAEEGGNGHLEGARGRLDLGLRRHGQGPLDFEVGLFADGVGQSNFEAYGIDLRVNWRF